MSKNGEKPTTAPYDTHLVATSTISPRCVPLRRLFHRFAYFTPTDPWIDSDFLTGERTYLGKGLSISPHKQFLTRLFDEYTDRSWNQGKVRSASTPPLHPL
eukprot:4041706-Pyramimonas_sp.AAC.1